MGEGSAVLVLEEKSRAVARGAKIYAEVLGYALTNRRASHDRPKPTAGKPRAAMELALRDAGAIAQDVSYVNAHGSSRR